MHFLATLPKTRQFLLFVELVQTPVYGS